MEKVYGYPRDFLSTLADTASEALSEWLKKNTTPEIVEFFQAIECLRVLESLPEMTKPGDDSLAADSVRIAAMGIKNFGDGVFYGSQGENIVKNDQEEVPPAK